MAPESPYPDGLAMREARVRYFELNGFGAMGGYDEPFVDFALGPVSMRLPNTEARLRAVRYHDLHHVVTGYQTDTLGEFEISAWELGAGCRSFLAAWVLNLGGLAAGALRIPARTFRAFLRGRHSRSLYGEPLELLLSESVGQVRARTGLDRADGKRAGIRELSWFAWFVVLGLLVGTLLLIVGATCALPLLFLKLVRSLRGPRGLSREAQ